MSLLKLFENDSTMEITSLLYFAFPHSRRRCFLTYLLTIQWQAVEINVIFNKCYLNKVLHLPLIMSAHHEAAKWISLDWSSFGKRVVSMKQNSSVKTTWVKTNKCSHLKEVRLAHTFCQKVKENQQKKFILVKLQLVKLQPATLIKRLRRRYLSLLSSSVFFTIQKLLLST